MKELPGAIGPGSAETGGVESSLLMYTIRGMSVFPISRSVSNSKAMRPGRKVLGAFRMRCPWRRALGLLRKKKKKKTAVCLSAHLLTHGWFKMRVPIMKTFKSHEAHGNRRTP